MNNDIRASRVLLIDQNGEKQGVMPLSAALEPTRGRRAQIVIFERPLELRATSRGELRRLVHQTIVEQLSALTGRSIAELGGEEGWDD